MRKSQLKGNRVEIRKIYKIKKWQETKMKKIKQ